MDTLALTHSSHSLLHIHRHTPSYTFIATLATYTFIDTRALTLTHSLTHSLLHIHGDTRSYTFIATLALTHSWTHSLLHIHRHTRTYTFIDTLALDTFIDTRALTHS